MLEVGGQAETIVDVAHTLPAASFVLQDVARALACAHLTEHVKRWRHPEALVLLAVSVLGIVGSAWLGRLVARASLKPVDYVADAAEEVARTQDLSALIPVTGSDETWRDPPLKSVPTEPRTVPLGL